jgi:NTP pyrophosphatase (non-canonical NTP hydrolase)
MKKEMTLNEYQEKAITTCMPSSDNFGYMFLNLVGEVGELASKVAKYIRKEKASIVENELVLEYENLDEAIKDTLFYEDLKKEAGDCLWQLSGLCTVMGWTLEDVAQTNLDKLAARKAIGTIDGNGDGIERAK